MQSNGRWSINNPNLEPEYVGEMRGMEGECTPKVDGWLRAAP